ncbi:MAG: DUF3592 domain-containing protein [Longimicrobiales bacterium]
MSDSELTRRLSPPPRSLPVALSIRVVLGGFGQIGWLLLGFGLIFVWAFGADRAVVTAFRLAGGLEVVEGTTTGWRELNLTINDVTVYETSYAFSVEGRSFSGASYETGYYAPEGQRLPVEYRPSNPEASRLQGMRASPTGLVAAFVLIIPLIGLIVLRAGLRRGFRARRLLAEGVLAHGTLVADEVTNAQVNEQSVHRMTFEFTAANGGSYQVVTSTHAIGRLLDDAREAIVYDPRHPADATTLDDLPGRPTIDERGELRSGGAGQAVVAFMNLLVPAATIFGHGAFLLLYR